MRRSGSSGSGANRNRSLKFLVFFFFAIESGGCSPWRVVNIIFSPMARDRKALRPLIADGIAPERALGIGMNLALVVGSLHSRGRIHGSLHPGMITVGDDDTVALDDGSDELDPTLAVLEELAGHRADADTPLDRLAYQSPEQLRGTAPQPTSDVFSVGCILYEMVTGRPPFSGETREALIADVSLASPVDVLELAPQVSRAFARAIHSCLELRPSDRFASLDALADELQGVTGPRAKHRTTVKTQPVSSTLVSEPDAFDDVPDDLLPSARPDTFSPAETAPPPAPVAASVPSRLRLAVFALALLAVASVSVAVYLGTRGPPVAPAVAVDSDTLLVVPMEVRGENSGADYLGRAFAEAIAINLALDGTLKVLPVPTEDELTKVGSLQRATLARKTGAGKLITGSITRTPDRLSASLSLVDTAENRILWGATELAGESDYTQLAVTLVRRLGEHLGSDFPQMYDYITNLTGGPAMAASPTTAAVIAALRDGNIESAVTKTEALITAFPEEPDAWALRAHSLLLNWDARPSTQNMERLENALKRLRRIDPRSPYDTFYRGYVAQRRGDRRDAVLTYSSILERDDLSPRARAWVLKYRANVEQELDNDTAALEDLQEALRADPANPWTLAILSETLRNAGRLEEALVRGRQAVNLAPRFWRNHQSVGLALSELGRFDESAVSFAKACELSGAQSPCALTAISLWRTGDTDAAETAAAHAETLSPRPWGLYNLACFHALSGERNRSMELLEGAAEIGLVYDQVASDADLASLKGDPRFDAVVAKVAPKN